MCLNYFLRYKQKLEKNVKKLKSSKLKQKFAKSPMTMTIATPVYCSIMNA